MYYENATCTGDNYISGTLMYVYGKENSLYDLQEFKVEKYDGPCHYFAGGFYDFSYGEPESGFYFKQGYCLKCNGVVGCSPITSSCHEFSSVDPRAVEDDIIFWDDEYYNGYAVSEAERARKTIKRQVQETNEHRASYVAMGVLSMILTLSVFTGSLAAVRKLRDSNLDFCKDGSRADLGEAKDSFDDVDDDNFWAPNFVVI